MWKFFEYLLWCFFIAFLLIGVLVLFYWENKNWTLAWLLSIAPAIAFFGVTMEDVRMKGLSKETQQLLKAQAYWQQQRVILWSRQSRTNGQKGWIATYNKYLKAKANHEMVGEELEKIKTNGVKI